MSPLIISLVIFCVWPLIVGGIGYLIGRRRLVIRSPILVHRLDPDDDSEADEQPVVRRLARHDVGFGK